MERFVVLPFGAALLECGRRFVQSFQGEVAVVTRGAVRSGRAASTAVVTSVVQDRL